MTTTTVALAAFACNNATMENAAESTHKNMNTNQQVTPLRGASLLTNEMQRIYQALRAT